MKLNLPKARVQDAGLQRVLDAVNEALQRWNGERGDPLDRVVTLRDFREGGTAGTALRKAGGAAGDFAEQVGGVSDRTPPAALTNLAAFGALANVILRWDGTNQDLYAHAEVWRSSTDDLGTAELVGTTPAKVFADDVGEGAATYYYWVRPISTAGVAGPFNATAGVSATSGQVQETDIAFGAVVADHIAVANLAAVSADLGSITAGSININNKFIVDSQGNTTVRNATSGARLEMRNNVIKVFDAAGTLRVRIGDLTA